MPSSLYRCTFNLYVSSKEDDSGTVKASKKSTTKVAVKKANASAAPKSRRRKVEISTSSKNTKKLQPQNDNSEGDETNQAFVIPTKGTSLADSMNKDEEFVTTLTPILHVSTGGEKVVEILYNDQGIPIGVKEDEDGDEQQQQHEGVARIDTTTSDSIGEEPVRWLVSLKDPNINDGCQPYFMFDIPPYSDKLANEIKAFMDPNYNNSKGDTSKMKGKLDAILVTNQQSIHYDQSPGVYVTRTSDLEKWKKAFPEVKVIMYRLDQPRECRESVTQVLDGYGPWGWENADIGFVETGRPLQVEEWDESTASNVIKMGETPPDDRETEDADVQEDDELYSKDAIRKREDKYDLLAVYTPGHTFGSVTYVFPQRGICCSGYSLPMESAYDFVNVEEDGEYTSTPIAPQGPRLDYQGYIATSVSRPRQMSSASKLINDYIDRFAIVLPARGDVVFLDSDNDTRKRDLMENIGLYTKISEIYGRLGIAE